MIEMRIATADDLQQIETWLDEEQRQTGWSFAVNLKQIRQSAENGELVVARAGGQCVGFHFGWFYSPGITAVRLDRRGEGIGTAITNWVIDRARSRGVCALAIECSPAESRSFWERQGFSIFEKDYGPTKGFLELHYNLQPPERGAPVTVDVSFYDEEDAIYPGIFDPVATKTIQGKRESDTIFLSSRAFGFSQNGPRPHPVILVEVGDAFHLFYPEHATAAGTQRDEVGWWFFDQLDLSKLPSNR